MEFQCDRGVLQPHLNDPAVSSYFHMENRRIGGYVPGYIGLIERTELLEGEGTEADE
jgi:hypothetical protein